MMPMLIRYTLGLAYQKSSGSKIHPIKFMPGDWPEVFESLDEVKRVAKWIVQEVRHGRLQPWLRSQIPVQILPPDGGEISLHEQLQIHILQCTIRMTEIQTTKAVLYFTERDWTVQPLHLNEAD